MKIGVISNLLSTRNRRGVDRLREVLAAHEDVLHVEIDRISDLGAAVEDFAHREVGLIVINGGDGTVQATLTELLTRRPYETLPLLAVMPGGMSNMIAGDVGVRAPGAKGLSRLITEAGRGSSERTIATRHVIRMERGERESARYGMFFGTAAIFPAIEMSRDICRRLGIREPAAAGLTLANILGRRLVHGRRPDRVYRSYPITVELDGKRLENDRYLLLLVTTLERLVLHARPFRGDNGSGLSYMDVAFPPPRFLRRMLPLLYGRWSDDLPPEYTSCHVERVTLVMDCPFTLDGELFRPASGTRVTLSDAGKVRFVRL